MFGSLITATFDKNMDAGDDSIFVVYGSQTGKLSGIYTGGGSDTLSFDAGDRFKAGEEIEIILTDMLTSTDGLFLESPFVYRLTAETLGGTGDFTPAASVSGQTDVETLVAGDWDGDGDLDLAAANFGASRVDILRNDGLVGLQTIFTVAGTVSGQTNVQALAAGDWDGDGDLDLAAANFGASRVDILRNDGPVGPQIIFTVAGTVSGQTNVQALVAGDWDGDGDLDLAAANSGNSTVGVLKNNGRGGFTVVGTVSGQTNVQALVAGDWDGDDDLDLAAANFGASSVDILRNNGAGVFTSAGTVSGQTNVQALVAGDWNGDGDLDLAAANFGASRVDILRNDGLIGLQIIFTIIDTVSDQTNVRGLAAGDWDGDDDLDLAAANSGISTVRVLENRLPP